MEPGNLEARLALAVSYTNESQQNKVHTHSVTLPGLQATLHCSRQPILATVKVLKLTLFRPIIHFTGPRGSQRVDTTQSKVSYYPDRVSVDLCLSKSTLIHSWS